MKVRAKHNAVQAKIGSAMMYIMFGAAVVVGIGVESETEGKKKLDAKSPDVYLLEQAVFDGDIESLVNLQHEYEIDFLAPIFEYEHNVLTLLVFQGHLDCIKHLDRQVIFNNL